jgi:hypothetical protein
MRIMAFICILIGAPFFSKAQGLRQDGFGIVPLHSTRADVERLYGPCNGSTRCIFRTASESIAVAFASSPCTGFIYGWNVPKNTVLSLTVTPYIAPRLSEIPLELNGFATRYSPDDILTIYYTNTEKGVLFAVQNGRVISETFYPPSRDNMKRCEGFPAWDAVPAPTPFATITSGFSGDVEAVLDNLAFELSSNSRARGYIVAYAGKESRRGEAKEMADKARQYLINRRAIASDRVIACDGGFREMAQYDLFSLSAEMSPPTPTPTVPSNKVQIVEPGTRAKRRLPKLRYAYEKRGEDQIK